MDVVEALGRRGGAGTRAELIAASDRQSFERALRDGLVERVARGRYALPTASAARRAAAQLSGTAVLLSAAAHHGWALKWQPRTALSARGARRRVARVVELADSRAANPFESVLRAIALEVPGLSVEPQVRIDRHGRWVGRATSQTGN